VLCDKKILTGSTHLTQAPSPLLWTRPGEPPGQEVERIRFSYEVIELWEKHPEDLLCLKHVELLPLTKGGATREIVEVMFEGLAGEPYRDVESLRV
jgi:hypothetical protein